jgi:predicted DNA-binding transcriptional regulator YafY
MQVVDKFPCSPLDALGIFRLSILPAVRHPALDILDELVAQPRMNPANDHIDGSPLREGPGGTVNGLASVTAAELADLGTAISLLRRENMDLQAENAERGIAKMRALVKRPVMNRIEPDLEALTEAEGLAMRPGPRPKINAEIVSVLREAIITRRKVRLRYRYRGSGKRGYQVVHPYGFLYGNRHYLVAWSESEEARDFRSFALSNIELVELLDRAFIRRRRFSLREYGERSFGVFQEKPVDVVWKFSPKAAPDAREFLFHPTQVIEEQPDGSLIVRFRAGGLQEMAWHLVTWGDQVNVIQPRTLISQPISLTCKTNLAKVTMI